MVNRHEPEPLVVSAWAGHYLKAPLDYANPIHLRCRRCLEIVVDKPAARQAALEGVWPCPGCGNINSAPSALFYPILTPWGQFLGLFKAKVPPPKFGQEQTHSFVTVSLPGQEPFRVDHLIAEAVEGINRKGYRTLGSCQGDDQIYPGGSDRAYLALADGVALPHAVRAAVAGCGGTMELLGPVGQESIHGRLLTPEPLRALLRDWAAGNVDTTGGRYRF